MSSKKKRLAKGLGAGALAVATIVSGLSFGAASASAAPVSVDAAKTVQFVWQKAANDYRFAKYVVQDVQDSPGSNVNYMTESAQFRTLAAAKAAAPSYAVHPLGDGAFQLKMSDGECLRDAPGAQYVVWDCDDPETFLRQDATGAIYRTLAGHRIYTSTQLAPWEGGGGVYTLTSTGEPDSRWIGIPSNLGSDYAGITANGSFDADIAKKATVSGTAEPAATVTLKKGATTLGTTTAAEDGTYSFDVDAPNKGGALALTVTQTIDGKDGGSKDVELDYGKAVAITGPEDQEEVAAGSTAITGSGEAGSDVQVFDNSGRNPVISAKVRSNGTWSGTATLTAGEHTLEAKQMSKGANTTTATVTVNPGQSALTAAEITTDEYTPGQRTTFAGTATAGATVDILDGNGSVIVGGVRVAENGSFSFQHTPAANSTEFSFRVRQTLGDATRTDGPFTIDATVDAFAPVTVSRPATVTPGVENVFSGTATPNATYRVLNASGSQIVPGTFTIDADGNWTFRRAVSTGASKFDFKLEQTLNGETRTSQLFSIRANAGYTVTNTTRSVRPGVNNTFTGTGPAGASYRVLNMSGTQIVPGTFDIDGQGNWTFDRVVSLGAPNFKFKLEVTTADGATFTSPLYTVNAASLTPVTVDTTEVFPGRQNTFEGTGEPGASYTVLNMSDTVLDPSIESTFRVGQDGKWEFKRVVSMGAANFKFKIRQTLNGQTTTSDLFTIDAATFQAPTVDNEYVNAGIWNTFTGTVTPGATIRVLNTSNNELSGVTDLVVGADGKYSFKRIVGATSTKLDFRIEQTHLGKTMIGDTVTLQARTADVTIDNTTVTPGRVNTFTGTATPDATFQVFTVGNVGDAPLASGTVSAQGRFAFDRTVGAGATSYAFKIVLTKDGKQSVSAPFTITASTR
ncbi:Ig-like domain-containing protein [Curtobacterium sp. NPDC098951]|uniref:Ig-like domain-containing protein n=1 Tax=Curtobacterium sp. NPDC098951 TaxID=3363974 RepID=UPI003826A215